MTSRTKYPICADLTEQTDSNEEKIAAKLTIYDTPKHLTYKKKVSGIAIIFGGREFVCASQASKRTIKD